MRPGRDPERAAGVAYALAAYLSWGLTPIFWKQLIHVPALETLAHRVVWSVPVLLLLLGWRGRLRELRLGLRRGLPPSVFAVSGILLSINWLTYIYAVNTERLLDASLGYFINPILNVVLGMLFFRERLRSWQWVAVGLAAAGVAQLATRATAFPWIALVLAVSFGAYGVARKAAEADALLGSNFETLVLTPVALGYLLFLEGGGRGHLGHAGVATDLLLAGTGVATALPLLWFSSAARRLPLSTVGFFQYLAPTCQFLLAVFAYGEAFTALHLRSFLCIWTALAVYLTDARLAARRRAAGPLGAGGGE